MADVNCAHCGEPWEGHYLRHDLIWTECVDCGENIVKFSDGSWQLKGQPWHGSKGNCQHTRGGRRVCSDDHGPVPASIENSEDVQAWFHLVVAGRGCPNCGDVGPRPNDERGQANVMALFDSAVFDGDPAEYL
ncbi:hypothetical protein GCM10029976_090800 [Kribbella albertanoniae]|uniref:Uncharacterized protein n=1 Tax=Kribbella albertanoniae TaxID=1266829 RepID=A0A4R4PJB5_9ACTN|nr:hypothetical protein [Kribbella albertanoniae]TDC22150.1 hypothetical protein E1261_31670 [Kribbella albertanoniae]